MGLNYFFMYLFSKLAAFCALYLWCPNFLRTISVKKPTKCECVTILRKRFSGNDF